MSALTDALKSIFGEKPRRRIAWVVTARSHDVERERAIGLCLHYHYQMGGGTAPVVIGENYTFHGDN